MEIDDCVSPDPTCTGKRTYDEIEDVELMETILDEEFGVSTDNLIGALEDFHPVSDNESTAASTVAAERDTTPAPENALLTGRPSVPLYLSCNPDHLSEYQCLLRKNIELFEATDHYVTSTIKGRNKPIVKGQVGLRCCHCAHVFPLEKRGRASMYFPRTMLGIYQAAQTLAQQHILMDDTTCPHIPPQVREELRLLKTKTHSSASEGKEYWAATAKVLGVYEDADGLRFEERFGIVRYGGKRFDLLDREPVDMSG
eukprot:Nitzschia sp. Nitz4//scaffold115_size69933//1871//2638//NITZ4_005994-RA/size69933-processed-gene-0.116-mRNA-1//-1//CDS//3329533475//9206//frame0